MSLYLALEFIVIDISPMPLIAYVHYFLRHFPAPLLTGFG
jgi:hypothetical protein